MKYVLIYLTLLYCYVDGKMALPNEASIRNYCITISNGTIKLTYLWKAQLSTTEMGITLTEHSTSLDSLIETESNELNTSETSTDIVTTLASLLGTESYDLSNIISSNLFTSTSNLVFDKTTSSQPIAIQLYAIQSSTIIPTLVPAPDFTRSPEAATGQTVTSEKIVDQVTYPILDREPELRMLAPEPRMLAPEPRMLIEEPRMLIPQASINESSLSIPQTVTTETILDQLVHPMIEPRQLAVGNSFNQDFSGQPEARRLRGFSEERNSTKVEMTTLRTSKRKKGTKKKGDKTKKRKTTSTTKKLKNSKKAVQQKKPNAEKLQTKGTAGHKKKVTKNPKNLKNV